MQEIIDTIAEKIHYNIGQQIGQYCGNIYEFCNDYFFMFKNNPDIRTNISRGLNEKYK